MGKFYGVRLGVLGVVFASRVPGTGGGNINYFLL